jgi:hypothetical protein
VGIRETNASELLMTRRKLFAVVKTRGAPIFWDKSVGNLITGRTATGV